MSYSVMFLVARVHIGKIKAVFGQRDDARVREDCAHVRHDHEKYDGVEQNHIARPPQAATENNSTC